MNATLAREKSWAEIVATAKERIAIGQTDVYLGSDARDDLAWSKCVSMEVGSHRLDIYTSVIFRFEVAGLSLRWYFDIEGHEANGKGHYELDEAGIMAILARLPSKPHQQFLAYLKDCAIKIEERATEQFGWVKDQFGAAAILYRLADNTEGGHEQHA